MSLSIQPVKPPEVKPGQRGLVSRRAFSRIFDDVMKRCGLTIPGLSARQTADGAHFSAQREAEASAAGEPFHVDFAGPVAVSVAPGVVRLPGAERSFVLEASSLLADGPAGFACIRATVSAPLWAVNDGGDDVWDFAGWCWVDQVGEPRLEFLTGPAAMAASYSLTAHTSEEMVITHPVAFVDFNAGRIVQLCRHAVSFGFRRPTSSSFIPDLVIDYR